MFSSVALLSTEISADVECNEEKSKCPIGFKNNAINIILFPTILGSNTSFLQLISRSDNTDKIPYFHMCLFFWVVSQKGQTYSGT